MKKFNKYFLSSNKIKNRIVISGYPRGGTTWIFENILKTDEKIQGIWEPLHLKNIHHFDANINFHWRQYLSKKETNISFEKYMKKILNLSYYSEPLQQKNFNFKHYKKCNSVLIKFCRLNPMTGWFLEKFPNQIITSLQRNPLSIISSQIQHSAWDYSRNVIDKYPMDKSVLNYSNYYNKYQSIFDKKLEQCEVLAINYCLETIPFVKYRNNMVKIFKYEDILANPEKKFKEICEINNLSYSKFDFENLKIKSSTTNNFNLKKQTNKWVNNINENQYKKIIRIFDYFKLNDFLQELEYL